MATTNESEVRAILTPDREAKIDRAYNQAWNDWSDSPHKPKLSRWPRTRANNVFEYLVNYLIEEFSSDAGVRFIFHTETFKLIFDERLVVRFKYASKRGLGANVDTQAVFDYCDPQTDLPGMPSLQKVEIDYNLNVTETAIAEIAVIARNGKKRLWSYNINATGAAGAEVVPLLPPSQPVPSVEDMVTPRRTKKAKKSKEGQE